MNSEINYKYNDLLVSIIKKLENEEVNKRFEAFVHELIEYCSTETSIFSIYRILKEIDADIVLKKKTLDPPTSEILGKLSVFINTEIEIIVYKMNQPSLIDMDNNIKDDIPPLVKWTDEKVSLVELIYALADSVNNGNGSTKSIAACFEYFFQIDLTNHYRTFIDINARKSNITRFLDKLPKKLLIALDRLNK